MGWEGRFLHINLAGHFGVGRCWRDARGIEQYVLMRHNRPILSRRCFLESEKGVFRRGHQKTGTAGFTPHTMIDAARLGVDEIAGIECSVSLLPKCLRR